MDHAVHLHIGPADAVQPFDGHRQHLRPAAAKQPGGVAQLQLHADPVALDVDRTHTAGTHRVLIQMGVGVLAQYGFHSFAGDGHGYSWKDRANQTGILPCPVVPSPPTTGSDDDPVPAVRMKKARRTFIVANFLS